MPVSCADPNTAVTARPNRPQLTSDQKAYLIYEIMVWAITNKKMYESDAPKYDLFGLLQVITKDDSAPMRADPAKLFIQQLRKSGELWAKVRPFLVNANNGCLTAIDPAQYINTGAHFDRKCNHGPEMHKDGKCTGENSHWQPNPGEEVNGQNYYQGKGKWVKTPCICTQYTTRQKW